MFLGELETISSYDMIRYEQYSATALLSKFLVIQICFFTLQSLKIFEINTQCMLLEDGGVAAPTKIYILSENHQFVPKVYLKVRLVCSLHFPATLSHFIVVAFWTLYLNYFLQIFFRYLFLKFLLTTLFIIVVVVVVFAADTATIVCCFYCCLFVSSDFRACACVCVLVCVCVCFSVRVGHCC